MSGKELRMRFAEVFYKIEATHYEQTALWREWNHMVKWEEISFGSQVTIGYLGDNPIVVSLSWARLNGKLILFYYGQSRVVDHSMVENWINTHCKAPHTDPTNFGHCISAVRND